MNPRYFHDSLDHRTFPSKGERSRKGGLNEPWDLLK